MASLRAARLVGTVLLATAWAAPLQAQADDVAMEFDSLHFRSIGPATMSGRISDLAVFEVNPAIYYVGTAHGGVWKTTSGGALWTPLFQDQGLIAIGDVTISQTDPDLVWVGAGESNNRQSTSWGGGVYRSTDGGETFQHMGLAESRHVNRIAIDPRDDDVVLVAATGPLFGAGGDRGVFKTTDGGETWTPVLTVDDDTGANDLVRAPTDADLLYASTYQRRRTACCMNGGGPGSGVWKSTDGGDTWTRVSGGGFPDGPLGRIALGIYQRDADIVYALVEAPRPPRDDDEEEEPENLTGLYRSNDGGETWTLMSNTNPRPMYFSQVVVDPTDPDRVYLGGVGLHLSVDGGEDFETDAARATHDDVHAIWINPVNPEHIIIGNDGGLAVSWDRSRTWQFLPNLPVGLFYHVNYDLERPFNVCGGMQDNYNWCGPSASRQNRGILNSDWFQVRGGDGFVAMPDLNDPRIVYAESQGGNMMRRDKVTGESKGIRPSSSNVTNYEEDDSYRWNWDTPFIRSPHDPGVLLAAAQRVFRSTDRGDSWEVISPDLTRDVDRDTIATMGVVNTEIEIARNDGISRWSTLVSLAESPVRGGLYYTGSDDGVVSVSRDGGATWTDLSANLPGKPEFGWVSEVVPSAHAVGRAYVTVDNHLHNDYDPYVWVSEDFGRSFRSITSGLEGQNVRTLTEDPRNPDVLYVGTETGIFLSLDRGESWRRLRANLPTVRVDEITIHPRDNAMIVGTHGRAIWILDHLEPIQGYTAAVTADAPAQLFAVPEALQWKNTDLLNDEFWGHQFFAGENPPTDAVIQYQVNDEVDALALRITDPNGRLVRELEATPSRRQPGIRTLCWDLRHQPTPGITLPESEGGGGGGGGGFGRGGGGGDDIEGIPTSQPEPGYMPTDPCDVPDDNEGPRVVGAGAGPWVTPGSYEVALVADGEVVDTERMSVVMDPAVRLVGTERIAYDNVLLDLHDLQSRGMLLADALNQVHTSVEAASEEMEGAPGDVRSTFEAFQEDWDELRGRFGVPIGGGGGRGGFGRGGGGSDNVLGRVGSVKNSIGGIWETPSDALMAQYYAVKPEMEAAMDEAVAMLERARVLAQTLGDAGIEFEVPETPMTDG